MPIFCSWWPWPSGIERRCREAPSPKQNELNWRIKWWQCIWTREGVGKPCHVSADWNDKRSTQKPVQEWNYVFVWVLIIIVCYTDIRYTNINLAVCDYLLNWIIIQTLLYMQNKFTIFRYVLFLLISLHPKTRFPCSRGNRKIIVIHYHW